jgi:putative transposase
MDDEIGERIAVFRYGVIRDLVSGLLAPGEKERLLAEIAEREWQIPGSTRSRIGRSTAREWVEAYQATGFAGLKPVERSDRGSSRAIPEPVQDLLLAVRAERPKASVRSLIRAVRLAGRVAPEVSLAPSTVYRFLAAHGVPVVAEENRGEPDAQAFSFPHANDLWVADVMHGPSLLEPGRGARSAKTYLIALLDDATRMAPYAAFYPSESAGCFAEAFKQAILRRGIPRRLYVDNGSAFRTHHLAVVCATLNVALIHSRPHRPRGRGKVERFFRTVRSAFLPHVDAKMLAELATLNRVFWAWLEAEYHQTPHGGLDGQTPLERFIADQALLRPAPEDLEGLLRMRVMRVVGRDRTVRLNGRVFEAPDGLAGERVEVLFDPFDPRRPVHFRLPGETEERPLRRLDLAVNATLPRPRLSKDEQPAPDPPRTGISYLDLLAERFFGGDDSGEKS